VLDAAARERLIDRFGSGAAQWCDTLPELVSKCCLHWALELIEARSGATSRVFLGRQRGGRGVVLKLTPDRSVADTEAVALRAWAASPHAANLLDADPETSALLLEKLERCIESSLNPATSGNTSRASPGRNGHSCSGSGSEVRPHRTRYRCWITAYPRSRCPDYRSRALQALAS